MRPIDVKTSTYIESGVKNNYENILNLKLMVVRISKHIRIFTKGYTPNCSNKDKTK